MRIFSNDTSIDIQKLRMRGVVEEANMTRTNGEYVPGDKKFVITDVGG